MRNPSTVPVAIFIFNRPEETRRVVAALRVARPERLFIIADGPRSEEERPLCEATRKVVEKAIDWPCEVHKNYAEKNMGCDPRVASGITWVFEHVDRAIILEDDCVAHPDFFPYCAELLERYEDDERVMHISGNNFQQENKSFSCSESYYFSIVPHIWGWATWRRAWERYDSTLAAWPRIKERRELRRALPDPAVCARFSDKFDRYRSGALTAWDGKWAFACITHHGLSVAPRVNLVSNIGFGESATHTKNIGSQHANLPTFPLAHPLTHPKTVVANTQADAYTYRKHFGINNSLTSRTIWFLKSRFPRFYPAGKALFRYFRPRKA